MDYSGVLIRDNETFSLVAENDGTIRSWLQRHFSPKFAVFILTFTLFLNYVDRGIISGASKSIMGCVVSKEFCCNKKQTRYDLLYAMYSESACDHCQVCDTFSKDEYVTQTGFGINTMLLGLLQSSFMIGFVFGAMSFAQLATRYSLFRLISIGLLMLIIACIGSGLSNFISVSDGTKISWSYYFMLFMRALSGVGEASVSTLALAFLDDILHDESKGFYIGIFYSAIPVGTAFGFIWSGMITSVTHGTWGWAYILEAPFIAPFAILAYLMPDYVRHPNSREQVEFGRNEVISNSQGNLPITNTAVFPNRMSLFENTWPVLSQPVYLLGVASYAIYTGVMAGISFYGPSFIQNYRLGDPRWGFSQAQADLIFGLIVSIGGLVGTLLGGHMLRRVKTQEMGKLDRNGVILQLVIQTIVGLTLCISSLFSTRPY